MKRLSLVALALLAAVSTVSAMDWSEMTPDQKIDDVARYIRETCPWMPIPKNMTRDKQREDIQYVGFRWMATAYVDHNCPERPAQRTAQKSGEPQKQVVARLLTEPASARRGSAQLADTFAWPDPPKIQAPAPAPKQEWAMEPRWPDSPLPVATNFDFRWEAVRSSN